MAFYAVVAALLNVAILFISLLITFGNLTFLVVAVVNAALAWCAVPALARLSPTPWREAGIVVAVAIIVSLVLFGSRPDAPLRGMYAPSGPIKRWVCPNGTIHFARESPCPGGTATD